MSAIRKVTVCAGKGQWGYWRDPVRGEVVADTICNHMAGHFAGKFTEPVETVPCEIDLQLDGFIPERPRSVWVEELE